MSFHFFPCVNAINYLLIAMLSVVLGWHWTQISEGFGQIPLDEGAGGMRYSIVALIGFYLILQHLYKRRVCKKYNI